MAAPAGSGDAPLTPSERKQRQRRAEKLAGARRFPDFTLPADSAAMAERLRHDHGGEWAALWDAAIRALAAVTPRD
jgi:hypothetical protein